MKKAKQPMEGLNEVLIHVNNTRTKFRFTSLQYSDPKAKRKTRNGTINWSMNRQDDKILETAAFWDKQLTFNLNLYRLQKTE